MPAEQRARIAAEFNADPSVEVLLASTAVGGLGLGLTGADVVIMFDHDFNPSRDAQAMDRAHRLGQKRAVSVYRLIVAGTYEERVRRGRGQGVCPALIFTPWACARLRLQVMNLQRFKEHLASAIVHESNASMETMDTGRLLDLLETACNADCDASEGARRPPKRSDGLSAILKDVGDLWDEAEYEEFDVRAFVERVS